MLHIEVLFTMLISIFLGFGITTLIVFLTGIDLFEYLSVLLLIVYVLTMFVFGLALSMRLNNKIFKHSVFQSIKEGAE